MLVKLQSEKRNKKTIQQGYRRENILSHTGFTSGYNNHPEPVKNRTGDLEVVLNF